MIQVFPNTKAASQALGQEIAALIQQQADCVLGLAAGSSPTQMHEHLVQLHRQQELSFEQVQVVHLDEYWPCPAESELSFQKYLRDTLLEPAEFTAKNCHFLDGLAKPETIAKICEEYEAKIAALGGVDLQILGLGINGHLAFNEPGSPPTCRTRLVSLEASTVKRNALGAETPRRALTQGIGTILEARRLRVVVFGKEKAEAVRVALEESPAGSCPGSWLQSHADVSWFLDSDAAAALAKNTLS